MIHYLPHLILAEGPVLRSALLQFLEQVPITVLEHYIDFIVLSHHFFDFNEVLVVIQFLKRFDLTHVEAVLPRVR